MSRTFFNPRSHSAQALPVTLALCLLAFPSFASEPIRFAPPPGVDVEAELILDSIALIDGGTSRGSAILGKTALTFDLDTQKAHLWPGGRVLVQVLGTFGDQPSSLAGDLQVFDNIEAGNDLRILEAWVEQSLGTKASFLIGYHDLNRELDVIDNAAELLNSSFGIGPEISQIGPSLFPRTHLGARLEIRPTSGTWVKIAGYDGLECDTDQGRYYAIESGWRRDLTGTLTTVKVAAGAWSFDAYGTSPASDPVASGGYVLAEANWATRDGRNVGAFLRAGKTNNDCQPIESYIGTGIRLANVLQSRPDDVISIGVARAGIVPHHRTAGNSDAETTLEITWLAQVHARVAIQPDVQYIDAPAGAVGVDHALVAGVRLILTY